MNKRLTDRVVAALPLPATGTKRHYDAPDANPRKLFVAGFGVRISAGGTRSFVLRYDASKTSRRVERLLTIGKFPELTCDAARLEALDIKRRIVRDGADPLAEAKAERDAPTVADLCDRFVAEYVVRKRANTQKSYTGIINRTIKPALGRKQVVDVDLADVERLHAKLSQRAPTQANRTLAVLSRVMTLATKWRMRPDNPCKGVERNGETARKRYLTGDELAQLTRVLAEYEDQHTANAFRLMLATGARKHEVLSAQWRQLDLDHRQVWIKPASTTKQRTEHEVPLGDGALQLLKAMRPEAAPADAYLFPGRSGGHLADVKRAWGVIAKRAGIADVHIHDLRHSYASFLASAGFGLPLIGQLLGHSQVATTARYSHLFPDAQRAAANAVGAQLAGLLGTGKPPRRSKLQVVSGGKP